MPGEGGEGSRSLLWLLLIPLLLLFASDADASDTDVLLEFKETLTGADATLPDWLPGSAPCIGGRSNWTGVICYGGNVYGLQLENKKLSGSLDLAPLASLHGLRTLSFMDNDFKGLLPVIEKLGALKAIYLSRNRFSGIIPDDIFTKMRSLKKVHLSSNEFSGQIPSSVVGLSKLLELRLEDNRFSGRIPELRQPGLKLVNVSNNELEGRIPRALHRMDKSFFEGNKDLCGTPLEITCNTLSKPKSKKLSNATIAFIVSAAAVVIIIGLILVAVLCISRLKRSPSDCLTSERHVGHTFSCKKKEESLEDSGDKAPAKTSHGKLMFVREVTERFELQDLLKASAEVLGSGSFGSSYKTALANGPAVVVKRFREMNAVGKEDFQEHMRRLGQLAHPNLLPLMAYYYRREEKLLITRYFSNGSLAHLLHGTRGSNVPSLDWPTRLKIVKGVAKGLAYLYDELPMLALPHGHLKSSNVLLDDAYEPLLTDYALVPVVNKSHALQAMVAYKSPEFKEQKRVSKKSDVWSFGILILEILTGKFPADFLTPGKAGTDMACWADSVVGEGCGAGQVFDIEMQGTSGCGEEMLKLLKIGQACCQKDEEKRCEMIEVLQKIEELREKEDSQQTGDSFVSRLTTDQDDNSFSRNS